MATRCALNEHALFGPACGISGATSLAKACHLTCELIHKVRH